MRRIIALLLGTTLFFQILFAKSDEIDFVQLAALLLKDGYVDRAYETLEQVDLNSSTVDKPYFYMLKGLILNIRLQTAILLLYSSTTLPVCS